MKKMFYLLSLILMVLVAGQSKAQNCILNQIPDTICGAPNQMVLGTFFIDNPNFQIIVNQIYQSTQFLGFANNSNLFSFSLSGTGQDTITIKDTNNVVLLDTIVSYFIKSPPAIFISSLTCNSISFGAYDATTGDTIFNPNNFIVNGIMNTNSVSHTTNVYYVSYVDSNSGNFYNCNVTDTFFATNNGQIICTTTSNCSNNIFATVSNGTPPYTYNWQPGNFTGNPLTTNVNGIYTCTVMDANGCTATTTHLIFNNIVNTTNILSNDSICAGEKIILQTNLIGTCGTYTNYCLPNNTINTGTYISKVIFNTLNNNSGASITAGSHTTFANTGNQTTTVYPNSIYTLSIGIMNGNANIGVWIDWNHNGTFGSNEYYMIDTTTNSSGYHTKTIAVPMNALAGCTKMRIRSRNAGTLINSGNACTSFANGETEDYSINVGQNFMQPVLYYGSNIFSTSNHAATIAPIVSSTYTILTNTLGNCYDTTTKFVFVKSQIPNYTFSSNITNAICSNYALGSMQITNTPIGGNFNFQWTPTSPNSSLYNGFAGTKSVKITDSFNNCTLLSDSIGTTFINCNYTIDADVTCLDTIMCQNNPSIIYVNSSPTANQNNVYYFEFYHNGALYGADTFAATTPNLGTFNIPTILSGFGTDSIVVKDLLGGFYDTVINYYYMPATINVTTNNCGKFSVTSNVGGPISMFSVTAYIDTIPVYFNAVNQFNQHSFAPGTYTITAFGNFLGVVCSATAVGTITDSLALNIIATNPNCGTIGSASASAGGTFPPFTYSWNTNPVLTTNVINNLQPNTYICTVTDANNCSASDSITLNNTSINLIAKASTDSICLGQSSILSIYDNFSNINNHCLPIFNNGGTTGDFINNFTVDGANGNIISNLNSGDGLPGCAGTGCDYTYYSQTPTNGLLAGNTYTLQVQSGQNFIQGYHVYIDYNNDGDFIDANEKIYTSINANTLMNTATFIVPSNINIGITRLRVVCKYNSIPNSPCAITGYGEVEDYKILLTNNNNYWLAGNGSLPINANQITVNPTQTTTYTLVTTDTFYCNDTATVTVFVRDTISGVGLTTIVTNASCPLAYDGSILVVSSPITSLQYIWNGNNYGNNLLDSLSISNHIVLVKDSNGGCVLLKDSVGADNINCGNINGYVYWDSVNNCNYNSNEPGISNIMITANPGNHITYTSPNGFYAYVGLPYGTYTVTQSNNVPGFINVCNSATNTILNISNSISSINFYDSTNIIVDYNLGTVAGCLRPGEDTLNHRKLWYKHNKPNIITSGTIFLKTDSIQHFAFSIPAPSSINGDTIFWNVNNIKNTYPSSYIDVYFAIDSTLPLGVNLCMSMGIKNTVYSDNQLNNNFKNYCFITCTSYDPNDKQVTPLGKTSNGYIPLAEPELNYAIDFQNTGTAYAGRVILMDTLDTDLDITKFAVQSASHDYQLFIIDNHILKIVFNNIMLPDSSTDLEGSKGFFSFSIGINSNVIAGTQIFNTAHIYFDYNAPVVTSTKLNTLYEPLQITNVLNQGNTYCNNTCGDGKFVITDFGGVSPVVYSVQPMCATTNIQANTINNLPAGNYTITASDMIGNIFTNINLIQNNSPTIATNLIVTNQNASTNPSGGVAPYTFVWSANNATTASVSNIVAGNYTVTVMDAHGCTKSESFAVQAPDGIQDLQNGKFVNINPNPTTGSLIIDGNTSLETIVIYNQMGQIVYQQIYGDAVKANLNITTLANGVYTLQCANKITKRIIKTDK